MATFPGGGFYLVAEKGQSGWKIGGLEEWKDGYLLPPCPARRLNPGEATF